jgi:Sec-independent protein translocase protein TatA
MFSIGLGEIILVLFLAVFLIGPKQIPEVLDFFKVAMRCWQRLTKEFKHVITEERAHEKLTQELRSLQKPTTEEEKS